MKAVKFVSVLVAVFLVCGATAVEAGKPIKDSEGEVTRLIEIQQAYQQSLNLVQSDDELKKDMLSRIRNS